MLLKLQIHQAYDGKTVSAQMYENVPEFAELYEHAESELNARI